MRSKRLKKRLTRKILRAMLREEQVTMRGSQKRAFRWTKLNADHYRSETQSDTEEQ